MSGILFIILLGLRISSSVAASHLPVLGATLQDIESDIFGALGEFQSYSQEEIDKHVQKVGYHQLSTIVDILTHS